MIHPVFREVPDASMANACSEIFDREFKFTTSPEVSEKYGEVGFPPTPSHLTSITAAYLEQQPSGLTGVRTRFMTLRPDMVNLSEIAGLYDASVRPHQEMSDTLEAIAVGGRIDEGVDSVINWHINTVAQTGGRLLAAHVTARTAMDDRLIDAVVTPGVVFHELPLVVRGVMTTLRSYIEELTTSDLPTAVEREKVQASMKTILRNDPALKSLGVISAASILPDAQRVIEELYAQESSVVGQVKQQSGNRAARRRQQRQHKR